MPGVGPLLHPAAGGREHGQGQDRHAGDGSMHRSVSVGAVAVHAFSEAVVAGVTGEFPDRGRAGRVGFPHIIVRPRPEVESGP